MFPATRMMRLRATDALRSLAAESHIQPGKLVMPVFIDEKLKGRQEIASMPGIFRHGLDSVQEYTRELGEIGVKSILLFGIPSAKDESGTSSHDPEGVIQKAVPLIKNSYRGLVITDLCLCEYTDHGHCGILKNGAIDGDNTLEVYRKIAVSYARAGADIIAPSGMIDGQVGAIRDALDSEGFGSIPIMSYSAKYASSLYSPFREAAGSRPSQGDRRSHQMDSRNWKEALREIDLDISEGADIVMVKPAMFYLDVLARARDTYVLPIAAYSVSAEYTMLRKAVDAGDLPPDSITEYIGSVFRAGADMVITYFTEYLLKANLPL